MKLRKQEKIWLLLAALCAALTFAVTAASRTPPVAATVVLAPLAPSASPNAAAPAALLDLNTATAAQLDALPGIGATLAQRIVDYRAANGNFRCVEDIMKVSGIGAGKFEKIQNSITVTQEDGT